MRDPAHPGLIILHECLEPLGISVPEAALALGVPADELSNLVTGRAGLSPEMAIRVGKVFGGSPRSWYRMQAAYDIAQAEKQSGHIVVGRQLWPASEQDARAHADVPAAAGAPAARYGYDPSTSTLSIPVTEMECLLIGARGGCRTMLQLFSELEAIGAISVTFIVENDDSPTANAHDSAPPPHLYDFLEEFANTFGDLDHSDQSDYADGDHTLAMPVPLDDIVLFLYFMDGVSQIVNSLFNSVEKTGTADAISDLSFTDLDDLARAEYIVEAWDAFVQNHPGIPDTAKSATRQAASPHDAPNLESLFQEISAFWRDNPLPRLAVPPSD